MRLILSIWLIFTGAQLYGQYGIGPLRLYTLEREAINLASLQEQYPGQPLVFLFWENGEFSSTKLLVDLSLKIKAGEVNEEVVFIFVQTAGKLNLRRYRSSNKLNKEIAGGERTLSRLIPTSPNHIQLLDLYSKTARRIVFGDRPKFPALLLFDGEGDLVMRQTRRGVSLEELFRGLTRLEN